MKKFLLSIFCCLMAVFAVQAEEYSYTFTAKQFSANGTVALNDVNWTLEGDGDYWGYDGTKGQQFGSSKKPYKSMKLSTNGISGTVTNIAINTSGGSSVNASFTVSVGGTQYGSSTKITATATDYNFEGSSSGEIVFVYTQTSSKAIYIKSIDVTYTSGEGGEEVITLEKPIISPEKTTFNDGESIAVAITAEEGATIHYTLDGNDPTGESEVYSGPLSITETTTVKAIAVKDGCNDSEVAEATYTAIDPNAAAFEIIADEQGYANGDVVETLTFGDVTATLAKGSNSNNAPKYYTTGKAIRAYGGNTITFTCATNVVINKIEFTFSSGEGSNEITADCGTYSDGVWNGSSNNVVFTIGGSSGHRRVAAIKVTYAISQSTGLVATLTVGEAGYATLYLAAAVQIPEGVSAYIVTGTSNGYAMMKEVTGIIPANTGLILKAESGGYEFAFYDKGTADVTGNLLTGTLYPTNVEEEAYVLSAPNGVESVGLYKALMTDGSWLNNANKAYLPATSVPNKTVEYYGFDWGGTTGIENIEGVAGNNFGEGAIYDLTGRKINSIAVTGIYIIDGKKVFIRK